MFIAPPPFWSHYTLESPWPLAGVLVVAALAMLLLYWRRRRRSSLWAAVAAAGLAGTVVIAAYSIDTEREQMIAATEELINLTTPMQLPELFNRIDPRAKVLNSAGLVWYDAQGFRAELESLAQNQGITQQKIDSLAAQTVATGCGNVLLRLTTWIKVGDMGEMPVATEWLISWSRVDGQWKVLEARWLDTNNNPATDNSPPRPAQ